MGALTWNFPTAHWGVGVDGDYFFPASFNGYFSSAITVAFAFCSYTRTKTSGEEQFFVAIGGINDENNFALTYFNDTESKLKVYFKHLSTGTVRYDIDVGDEDGSSWLADDKWYQVVISADSDSCLIAVNGTTSPTVTENTNAPGALALDFTNSVDRMYFNADPSIASNPTLDGNLPAFEPAVGPLMIHRAKLDLTDPAVLGRFFDADGNFKNPCENGSLWLDDTYGASVPDIYWPTGLPSVDNGAGNFQAKGGNSNAQYSAPGALRKMYE